MKAIPLILLCAMIVAVPVVPAAWAIWAPDGVPLCTATGDQLYPAIVSDGEGGAIVVWHDNREGGSGIYAQRVNPAGAVCWPAGGVAICTAGGEHPAIITDSAGGAFIVWNDARGATGSDIYAQRVNAAGTVEWAANGVPLCRAIGDQKYPTICSDDAGGAIVTWYDRRGDSYDIYAQRFSSAGAVQWAIHGVALCTASNNQYDPTIVSDGEGGAIVTWHDYRPATNADIYAQKVNASGEAQWAENGVALCRALWDQQRPMIVSDGAGGAIVTWEDERSGPALNDVYAQSVDASGAVRWTANGVALCTLMGGQNSPTLISDGMNGAIVTWFDYRGGASDIYAQRINASGAAQWAANGVPLCTAVGDQYYPVILPDSAGGGIITWYDNRSGSNWDIYAQRVNSSGVVRWTTDGVALSTATGSKNHPVIASDEADGAIVAWYDSRGDSWDIYAQRVDANGFLVLTGAAAPRVPAELRQNYPNPFNPVTTIVFELSVSGNVSLRIYDTAGRLVRELVNERRSAGRHEEAWDGRDSSGRVVASGIYFYRLDAGSFARTRKMVLLR